MSNKLPEGYIKWVPRVSDIVSFIYPFEWENKDRYLKWLKSKNIDEDSYLTTAQTTGTYIHQIMEDYVNWDKTVENEEDSEIVKQTIKEWKLYLDAVKKKYSKAKWYTLIAEPVLRDAENRFQWSSDLVVIHEKRKEVIIIDWKNFGIAKSFFNLPNVYRKPYDKIKKGRLQFSLYWETYKQKGYKVKDLVLVYLHESWAYAYSLEQYTSSELDKILSDYIKSLAPKTPLLQINYYPKMFKLEILHPTVQYGNIKLSCDLKELDNWDTIPETLQKMCKTAKVVANEMIKE